MGQHGAASSVEQWVVFERAHRGGDGIETVASGSEHGVARIERLLESLSIAGTVIGAELAACDDSCATMDGYSQHAILLDCVCGRGIRRRQRLAYRAQQD